MDENNNSKLTGEFSQYNDNKEALSDEAIAELSSEELEEILNKEKSRGRLQGIIISLAIVSVIAVFGILLVYFAGGLKTEKSDLLTDEVIEKTDHLWKMIDNYYLWDEDKDIEGAKDAVYKGIVNSLGDPYSVYYTKEEFDELLDEMEAIVYSGTKLNIDYYFEELDIDEEVVEEIYDYFKHSTTDAVDVALDNLDGDIYEEDVRLVRIKFISEMAN